MSSAIINARRLASFFIISFEGRGPESMLPVDLASFAAYLRRDWLAPAKLTPDTAVGYKLRNAGIILLSWEGKQIDCGIPEEGDWQDAAHQADTWLKAIIDFGYAADFQLRIENCADMTRRNVLLANMQDLPHADRKVRMKWFFGSEPYARQLRLQEERAATCGAAEVTVVSTEAVAV